MTSGNFNILLFFIISPKITHKNQNVQTRGAVFQSTILKRLRGKPKNNADLKNGYTHHGARNEHKQTFHQQICYNGRTFEKYEKRQTHHNNITPKNAIDQGFEAQFFDRK